MNNYLEHAIQILGYWNSFVPYLPFSSSFFCSWDLQWLWLHIFHLEYFGSCNHWRGKSWILHFVFLLCIEFFAIQMLHLFLWIIMLSSISKISFTSLLYGYYFSYHKPVIIVSLLVPILCALMHVCNLLFLQLMVIVERESIMTRGY